MGIHPPSFLFKFEQKGVYMTITLFKSTADPRVLNKGSQLVTLETVSAKVYYPLNILAPTFSIKYTALLISANYCYIQELGRYYFLNEPILESGSIITFTGNVDVLMSYRANINNLDCICLKSEYDYNTYIPCDIPSSSQAEITNYRFGDFSFGYPEDEEDLFYTLTLNGLVGDA